MKFNLPLAALSSAISIVAAINCQVPIADSLIAEVPPSYQKAVRERLSIRANREPNANAYIQRLQSDADYRRAELLEVIGSIFGYDRSVKNGYIFLIHPFSPEYRQSPRATIKNLWQLERSHAPAGKLSHIKRQLAANYKIHLMPSIGDTIKVVVRLLDALRTNASLQQQIAYFKVKKTMHDDELILVDPETDPEIRFANQRVLPRIVIYPLPGKQHAQAVIDILYQVFKNQNGVDVTPRFNQRITSLLYVAQGNGDDKQIKGYQKYYELPDLVYFTPENSDTTYHLTLPA